MRLGLGLGLNRIALGGGGPFSTLARTSISSMDDQTEVFPHEAIFLYLEDEGVDREALALSQIKWETADTGVWDALPATFPFGRDRGIILDNPQFVYIWQSPGAKTVTCTITTPAGTEYIRTFEVTVLDPEDYAARTILYDPTGTFSGVPAAYSGCTQISTTLSAAISQINSASYDGGQILFAPGAVLAENGDPVSNFRGTSWNDFVRIAPWDEDMTNSRGSIDDYRLTVRDTSPGQRVIISGIDWSGYYDPSTGNGSRDHSVYCFNSTGVLSVSDCSFNNVQNGFTLTSTAQNGRIVNCTATDWENYPVWITDATGCAVFACSFPQGLTAYNGAEGKNLGDPGNFADHGCLRFADIAGRMFIDSLDYLAMTGWSNVAINLGSTTPEAAPVLQPIRIGSTSCATDTRFSMSRVFSEGIITFNGGSGGGINNIAEWIFAKNIITLGNDTQGGFSAGHSNFYASNIVMIHPDIQDLRQLSGSTPRTREAWYVKNGNGGNESEWGDGVFRFYNCTAVDLRRDVYADSGEAVADLIDTSEASGIADDIEFYNMQYAIPNRTPSGEAGAFHTVDPLEVNTATLFTPRYPGYRFWNASEAAAYTFPSNATPANSVNVYGVYNEEATGASADTPAKVPAGDLFGNLRTTKTVGASVEPP